MLIRVSDADASTEKGPPHVSIGFGSEPTTLARFAGASAGSSARVSWLAPFVFVEDGPSRRTHAEEGGTPRLTHALRTTTTFERTERAGRIVDPGVGGVKEKPTDWSGECDGTHQSQV